MCILRGLISKLIIQNDYDIHSNNNENKMKDKKHLRGKLAPKIVGIVLVNGTPKLR
jgi:hypothetical protein